MFLLFKKDVDWIQPSSMKGVGNIPTISFVEILEKAQTVKKAEIDDWNDIDRLDVRPKKGIIKIRAKNRYEIQIDHQSGDVLQIAYRRSDLIESIHDGSFFHKKAKLWVFFPAAIVLLVLWLTGIYLFLLPMLSKRKKRRKELKKMLRLIILFTLLLPSYSYGYHHAGKLIFKEGFWRIYWKI